VIDARFRFEAKSPCHAATLGGGNGEGSSAPLLFRQQVNEPQAPNPGPFAPLAAAPSHVPENRRRQPPRHDAAAAATRWPGHRWLSLPQNSYPERSIGRAISPTARRRHPRAS
jgi:hypothetical protein